MFFNIVQIGAYIGKDEVHEIIKNESGLTALLIEPVPWNFEKLKQNYKNEVNLNTLLFDDSVINTYDGECEFYAVKYKNYSEPWATQLSSVKLNFIKQHEKFLNNQTIDYEKLIKKCIKPSTLICKYNITDIELLKIDIEGLDYDILTNWPYEKINPKYIQFEAAHIDGNVNSQQKIFSLEVFLKNKNYVFLKHKNLDSIYIRKF